MSQNAYNLSKARMLLLRHKLTYDNLENEIAETQAIIAAHPWSSIKKETDPSYCDDWRESKVLRLKKEQDATRILIEALNVYIKSLEDTLWVNANPSLLTNDEEGVDEEVCI